MTCSVFELPGVIVFEIKIDASRHASVAQDRLLRVYDFSFTLDNNVIFFRIFDFLLQFCLFGSVLLTLFLLGSSRIFLECLLTPYFIWVTVSNILRSHLSLVQNLI